MGMNRPKEATGLALWIPAFAGMTVAYSPFIICLAMVIRCISDVPS